MKRLWAGLDLDYYETVMRLFYVVINHLARGLDVFFLSTCNASR